MPFSASQMIFWMLSKSGFLVGTMSPAIIIARFFFDALFGMLKQAVILTRTGTPLGNTIPHSPYASLTSDS